jgi:hypothetical protein
MHVLSRCSREPWRRRKHTTGWGLVDGVQVMRKHSKTYFGVSQKNHKNKKDDWFLI